MVDSFNVCTLGCGSHQLQTEAMPIRGGIVHSVVALIVPDPRISIVSQ